VADAMIEAHCNPQGYLGAKLSRRAMLGREVVHAQRCETDLHCAYVAEETTRVE